MEILTFCLTSLVFYLQFRKYYSKPYRIFHLCVGSHFVVTFLVFTFVVLKSHKISRVRGPCWENNCSLFPIAIFFLIPCFLISSKWSLFFPPLVHVTVVTSCDSIETLN